MKNQEKTVLNRALKEQHFKNAEVAIMCGEESGSLKNPKLVKKLVYEYKGKTVQAPLEVIITSAIFLDTKELISTIEALKNLVQTKIMEELKDRIDKDELTREDALLALMLATSEMSKRNKSSQTEYE